MYEFDMPWSGKYKPKHPEKYKGNPENIFYRSRIEFEFMKYLDDHPQVVEWASEEFYIHYTSPRDYKKHRYFPDFWIRGKVGDTETISVVEIKHTSEISPPKLPKRKTKKYLAAVMTWAVNNAKWKAAENFCNQRGWKFQIITQKDLGLKY